MKKLIIASIFGFTVTACGTKETSTSGTERDSTTVDNTQSMSPSTMDSTMQSAPDRKSHV